MKLTTNTIAATLAAVLISGVAISPASAAVRTKTGNIDINEIVKQLDLESAPSYNTDQVEPQGDIRLVREHRANPAG